jgi:cell division protein FtsW
MMTGASSAISQKLFGNSFYFFKNQLLLGIGLGGLGFLITSQINYRFWKKLALPMLLASILLLSLVFVPEISYGYGGANRWLNLGGFSFQPSEIAKISLVIYLAAWLENKKKLLKNASQGILPFAVIVGIVGLLILLEPDVSTLAILGLSALIIFFAAGGRTYHLAIFGAIIAIVIITSVAFSPARLERLKTYINPQVDPLASSYQVNQALIALKSGGLWGQGIGESIQKYFYLPEPAGDSVFAIIGEETGFIGTSFVLLMFLLLGIVGFQIAKKAPDGFGRLLAIGLTALILIQALVNISAIIGLIPTTGVVLPFISYGGSAMAVFLISTGLLYNIAKSSEA